MSLRSAPYHQVAQSDLRMHNPADSLDCSTGSGDPSYPPTTFAASKPMARWGYRNSRFYLSVLAAFLQTVLLAGSIYLSARPWVHPSSEHIGSVSVKTFNVMVSVLGAIISAISAMSLAIGARSFISGRLATQGISLGVYESVRQIGEARLPWRVNSSLAIAPVLVFALANLAAPAGGGLAYTGYFFINNTAATGGISNLPIFNPLTTCLTTVVTGIGSGLEYFSQSQSLALGQDVNTDEYRLDVGTEINCTALSLALVDLLWMQFTQYGVGSRPLAQLIGWDEDRDLNTTISLTPSLREALASFTQALYSTTIIKEISQETSEYFEDRAELPDSNVTLGRTSVTSDALKIGPSGWNVLYIAVIAGMWVAVLFALRISYLDRPVSLDPLDPISILLVAQNSPPSAELDGGCTGDADQLRSREVNMRLCAIEPDHLGFVYGHGSKVASFPGPVLGQKYGRLNILSHRRP
ncbi:hypothetical protein RQP46_008772 [Phenoliferia psychrophenolica]